MAQHDYVIANGTGAAVRSDLNNALAAIVSNNSGATEPATMYAYQWWADTTTGLLKLRNAANNAWITLRELDGTLTIEDGTASSPGLAFADDLNTGIYSPSADQLGITTGGTVRLTTTTTGITSALPVDVPLGTASAPTVTFTGDTNTGIYSPGADQVAISSNGVQRLTVDTAATTSTLPVVLPLGAVGTPSITFTGDLNTGIWSPAADTVAASTGGSERLRIDSSGRVGIGTTSPTDTNVFGRAVDINGPDGAAVYLRNNGSSTNFGLVGYFTDTVYLLNRASGPITFLTNNAERARIDSSGRLLVGTSSARDRFFNAAPNETPLVQFEGAGVTAQGLYMLSLTANNTSSNSAAGANLILARSRGTAVGSYTVVTDGDCLGRVSFQGADGSELVEGASISALADGGVGANDLPTRLVFSTTADGASSPTERMRIGQNGYLKASNTGSYIATSNNYHELVGNAGNELVVRISNTHASSPYGVNFVFDNASPNNATNYFWNCADSTTTRATLRSNGGLANYSANNANLSDINTKKDISPAAGTWDCIKEWEIVNYRYKDQADDADLNLGVIAQQVAESCPEVITVFQEAKEATEDQPAQEERLGVKEQQMYWMAIKALQEAQVRIEQLEAEMAAVKAQLS